MSFHHPMLLWLLALPVVWGFWQWTRRGHPLVLPFDYGQQREGRRLGVLVNLANTLPALLLSVAILILAGPRRPAPPTNERILNNIILCLDMSGSMTMRFGSQSRFEAAVQAAKQFCEHRQGDAFGLTVFGAEYLHWFPPTKELSAIRNALPLIEPARRLPWFGGTLIAHALRGCQQRLVRTKEGDRAVILITDGGSADFANGGDRQVGQELADANIRVYTILIGSDFFGVDGIYTIAALTGGKVFRAEEPGALDTIFREIDQMQKARFKPTTADWVDFYRPLAFSGLGLGAAWLLTLFGLRYTPW